MAKPFSLLLAAKLFSESSWWDFCFSRQFLAFIESLVVSVCPSLWMQMPEHSQQVRTWTKDNKSNYDFSNEKCRGVIWGAFACAESWFGGRSWHQELPLNQILWLSWWGLNPKQLLDVCRAALSSSECEEDTHRNVTPPVTQKVILWDKTDKYHHAKVPQQDKWNNAIQVLVSPWVLTSCTVSINHLAAWVVCVHAFLDDGWHNPYLIFYAVVKWC